MLNELQIRHYAVIDELRLELGPGLNVLTGETGAGKSIIVGALSLLLGERASSEDVRAGEERAVVEAVFDVAGRASLKRRCAERGLELEDDWLILRREVQREGRNRAWVNGSPATASTIWELGADLVDLHGQHEHQALLRGGAQRDILDAYAGADELTRDVARLHDELQATREEIQELERKTRELKERADYLQFKADEIASAGLTPGEQEELQAEARRLSHSEELLSLSGRLHQAVYDDDGSLVERLGELGGALRELVDIDHETEELLDMHESARAELEELGRRLAAYRDAVDHDPGRLREIRDRIDEVRRLSRKYGGDVEDVLRQGRAAREELETLETSDARLDELDGRAGRLEEELTDRASRLTEARRTAADRLEDEVRPLLEELGMEGGVFEVHLEPRDEPGSHGAERIEFRVSLNPGFEPGPLGRIASGGEMSRVMLALKTVLARVDDVPSLVFDEIDAGIGGRVAHQVAERLTAVAEAHQVFVITHLPQIAARATTHYTVEKGASEEGRAATSVRRLSDEERAYELARMLGGDPDSAASLQHARELLAERRSASPAG